MVNEQEKNVVDPRRFDRMLQEVMAGLYELFELAKEHELPPVINGGRAYYEEDGKTGFQVSWQFKRPGEFFQTLLDIIRVNFEPNVLGTFFLNSNMCFLHEQIPDEAFQLGYISIVSDPDQGFAGFWENQVRQRLQKYGYDLQEATAIYAIATTGKDRYNLEFASEIRETLQSGLSVEDAICLIRSGIGIETIKPRKNIYSGFCYDPVLGSRIRLSLWFFILRENRWLQ